jgi:hypothetical protein
MSNKFNRISAENIDSLPPEIRDVLKEHLKMSEDLAMQINRMMDGIPLHVAVSALMPLAVHAAADMTPDEEAVVKQVRSLFKSARENKARTSATSGHA